MRVVGSSIALVLGMAALALATPLDPGKVAADATWVAHLDLDAMRASSIYGQVYQKVLRIDPNVEKWLDAIRGTFGLDLRKDLHGLTIYGHRIGKNDGVLVVHVQIERATVLDKLKFAPDYKTIAYRSHQLYAWTDAKGKKNEHGVTGAFYPGDLVVFAPTIDALKAALDVLDGQARSLAPGKGAAGASGADGTSSLVAAPIPGGTILAVAAIGLARAELPFKSPLVTQSETLSLVVGERQGEVFAEARLTTRSAQTAAQVQSILEGLRAMAELQHGEDPQVIKLLKNFRLEKAEKAVRVAFSAPAGEMWAMVTREWDRAAAGKPAGAPKPAGPQNVGN